MADSKEVRRPLAMGMAGEDVALLNWGLSMIKWFPKAAKKTRTRTREMRSQSKDGDLQLFKGHCREFRHTTKADHHSGERLGIRAVKLELTA